MNCPLCQHPGKAFCGDAYFVCPHCSGIFKNERDYLSPEREADRYREHMNDVYDPRYRKFVSPVTDHIIEHFTAEHHGLDFGSGTAPVISQVLREQEYSIRTYDPFFANHPEYLRETYDYIACCEVMEHFHAPDKEFELLHRLLKPGGSLLCMTHLYDESTPFKNWYYRNDPTHVFIYTEKTIDYIANRFYFRKILVRDRLIIFKK
ncbi:MAG: class I SAM-dependent methyltransferase [FCB group bacterium]|nr:class I SAM-dependent methyltransferase [FCB group bacterium]